MLSNFQRLDPLLQTDQLLNVVEDELESSIPRHLVLSRSVPETVRPHTVLVGLELEVKSTCVSNLAREFFPLLRNLLDQGVVALLPPFHRLETFKEVFPAEGSLRVDFLFRFFLLC